MCESQFKPAGWYRQRSPGGYGVFEKPKGELLDMILYDFGTSCGVCAENPSKRTTSGDDRCGTASLQSQTSRSQ